MKAIIHDSYGPIESLERRDIEPPTIGDHEVLVRVHAAAVHIGDVFAVWGRPLLVRTATGLRRPKYGVPGLDLAGTVEAVGSGVTRFAVGDEVFGEGAGTAAELARAGEDKLVRKPAALTGPTRRPSPPPASAALHGLRDAGRLEAGQRVLIVGASGGVGTFAVQIAKAMGAHVTGVTSTKNAELVRTARRRRCDRLHARRLHRAPRRVRPDPRQHREPAAVRRPPRAHPERHACPQQRHRNLRSSNAGPPRPTGRAVTVQLADDAPVPLDREPRDLES